MDGREMEKQPEPPAMQCSCTEYQCPCHKQLKELLTSTKLSGSSSQEQQAHAWTAVFGLCKANGMYNRIPLTNEMTGQQRVLRFIKFLIENQKS